MGNYYTFLGIFVYIIAATPVQAQTISDLCSARLMLSGVNYFNYPTDCEKFVQCHVDARGKMVGEIQQCAFSTYWSSQYLTCLPAEEIKCSKDKCAGKPNSWRRAGDGNCRGYWECYNGKSQPKCCPYGQHYETLLGCVNNEKSEDECKETCFNELKAVSNETVPCEKRAVPGDKNAYAQELAGWGWMKLPCAPGTYFEQNKCECVQVAEPVQRAACKPEIYLPFTQDHRDMSGKGHYIGNENVVIKDGVAYFNGHDSRLLIPRFNNIAHVSTVVIDIVYSSNHSELQEPQPILSNSDCSALPSIFITENDQSVTFGVGATRKFLASTEVPQPDVSKKVLRYKLASGVLNGHLNGQKSSVGAEGYVRNVQCALSVGHSANMASFYGQIEEFSIYLCDPELK